MGNHSSHITDTYELKLQYKTFSELKEKIDSKGIKDLGVFYGIDYTASNVTSGKESFNGKNLHLIETNKKNPYEEVLTILGKYLEQYSSDIYLYSFGDSISHGTSTSNMNKTGEPFTKYEDVVSTYRTVTPYVTLSGPTNFSPLIEKAIEYSKTTKKQTLLIILCDGQVSDIKSNIQSIKEAEKEGVLITCIGIGDGPFGMFCSNNIVETPNFHFVKHYHIQTEFGENAEETLAIASLQILA